MAKVSVITPSFNAEKYIGQTIRSVQEQTFSDWEQVVVDDGSRDSSADIVAKCAAQDPRVRLIQKPNGGVSTARNRGYQECCPDSRYLLFLDADDVLEPTMLEVLTRYLDDHPQVGMVHCRPQFIDSDDQPLDPDSNGWRERMVPDGCRTRFLPADQPETPFVSIYLFAYLIPSVSLMRRSVYEQTGGWDEEFGHLREDTDLYLDVALRSKVHYVPDLLVRYRRHEGQSTSNAHKLHTQKLKLAKKWKSKPGLTPQQRAVVRHAYRFVEVQHGSYERLVKAKEELSAGHPLKALRWCGGAVARVLTGVCGVWG